MIHRPRLLMIDGVADDLEQGLRQEFVAAIKTLCIREGVSVLWATEHTDDAAAADHLIALSRGQVVFDGAPTALLSSTGKRSLSEAISVLGTGPEQK